MTYLLFCFPHVTAIWREVLCAESHIVILGQERDYLLAGASYYVPEDNLLDGIYK